MLSWCELIVGIIIKSTVGKSLVPSMKGKILKLTWKTFVDSRNENLCGKVPKSWSLFSLCVFTWVWPWNLLALLYIKFRYLDGHFFSLQNKQKKGANAVQHFLVAGNSIDQTKAKMKVSVVSFIHVVDFGLILSSTANNYLLIEAAAAGEDVPGRCNGEVAYFRCDHFPTSDCERFDYCKVEDGKCVDVYDEWTWCQDYTTIEECGIPETKYPASSICKCCGDDSFIPNSCSFRFCDALTGSETSCDGPTSSPLCTWVHSCPAVAVIREVKQSQGGCSFCLSACSGMSSCCTGDGCMCQSDCSGGSMPPEINFVCPEGYTRRGATELSYVCCPSNCVKQNHEFWEFSVDDMECYCDSPVCATGSTTSGGLAGAGGGGESSAATAAPDLMLLTTSLVILLLLPNILL